MAMNFPKFPMLARSRRVNRTPPDPRFNPEVKTGLIQSRIVGSRTSTVLDLDDGDGFDFDIISSPVPDVLRGDLRAVATRLNGYGFYQQSRAGDGNVVFTPAAGSQVASLGVWVRWGFPTTAGLPGQLSIRLEGTDDAGNPVDFTAVLKPNQYSGGALVIPARILTETGLTLVTPLVAESANPVTTTVTAGVATATFAIALACRGSTQFGSLYSSIID